MPICNEEMERLVKERATLLGLLTEAENGRRSAPHYDGMAIDPVAASIEATRAKLATIEARLAGRDGEG
jgi:hypothetical protein